MLLPWRTIIENAAWPLECQGVTEERSTSKAKGNLLLNLVCKGLEKIPKDLSGGNETSVFLFETLLTGGKYCC